MQKYRSHSPRDCHCPVSGLVRVPSRTSVRKSTVHEELPTAQAANSPARTLASGKFHSVAHPTSGTAAVYQLADGTRVLRFTQFKTSNGPDVHVYLFAADDASDTESVKKAGFVDLGSIKGNIGDQNYTAWLRCGSLEISQLSPCGVSGSVSISAPRLSQRIGWRRGETSAGLRPVKLRDVE